MFNLMKTYHASKKKGAKVKNRKRGVSLESVMLGVVVSLFVLPQAMSMIKRNYDVQQDTISGRQFEMIADASRAYLAEQYNNIRLAMIATINDGGIGSGDETYRVVTPTELAQLGYLSRAMVPASGELNARNDQQYRLVIRAVRRGDTAFPQATLTKSDLSAFGGTINPDGTNKLNNGIIDAANNDDEMDLEAVLITVGGDPIPRARAARIMTATESPVATEIISNSGVLEAVGSGGNLVIPLSPWQGLGHIAGFDVEEGRMLSVISLSGLGDALVGTGGTDLRELMHRCYLLDPASPLYQECVADGNDMWSSIVFNHVEDRGMPGLYNLRNINCRPPVDENDPDSYYDNVTPEGTLQINCDAVNIDGNLTAETINAEVGNITVVNSETVNATVEVNTPYVDTSRVDTDTIELAQNNLANHLIVASGVVAVGQSIPLPSTQQAAMCKVNPTDPAEAPSLNVRYGVTGVIENVGRAISGYRPYVGPDNVARAIVFTNEDYCSTMGGAGVSPIGPLAAGGGDFELGDLATTGVDGAGDPITLYPNADYAGIPRACLFYSGSVVTSTRADGYPDAYWVNDGQGLISYEYTCNAGPLPDMSAPPVGP